MSPSPPIERHEHHVGIVADGVILEGIVSLPAAAQGVVAFAHGSGSGRDSPRNQFVAGVLQEAGLATLLLDLLTEEEERDRAKVFDIALLANRLQLGAAWLARWEGTRQLRLGYFGASTGAAAALTAAARKPASVAAVVSRGGRPDLAAADLPAVTAPTLLLVGSRDGDVLKLNEQALDLLRCQKQLVVIPEATHLFTEPGALEEVARLARDWFLAHLPTPT